MQRLLLALLSTATIGCSLASDASALKPIAPDSIPTPVATDPTPVVTAPPVQVAAEATTASEFVTVEQNHPTTGTARIVTEAGQRYLVFDEAFDTARGPDVLVVLYTGETVPVTLAEDDYVAISPLAEFTGAQRYLIPDNVDLSAYGAVAIWCRQFNVTFGYASL